jgi:exopolysaccharide biosynthesis polyprenyl glycosylphosphotransferase
MKILMTTPIMDSKKRTNRTLELLRFQGRSSKPEKLLVIADEDHLDMIYEMMTQKKWGIQVAYILSDSPITRVLFPKHSRIYPVNANIRSILRHDIVDEIVCCTSSLPAEYLQELADICQQFGVTLQILPYMKSKSIPVSGIRDIAGYLFLALETNPGKRFGYTLKSIAEQAFAASALLVLSPMLALIALLIKYTSHGPVFFRQKRVGLRGRRFYIYKFRTMVADAEKQKAALEALNETDGPAFKIVNDPRITRVGRILRKTGIDEIPQLYNVLIGDMALIGPRPMLPDEVYAQEEWHLKRLCIKPGITCTWQIQPERNKVPFNEWMQLDREYVENWSLGNDIKIFFGTFKSIFAARGA